MSLRSVVKRFVSEARERPHLAVTREVLNELDREADRHFDGAFVAEHMAIGKYTWMVRDLIATNSEESEGATLEIGEPVEIVGCLPTVVWLPESLPQNFDVSYMVPPLEIFDVHLEVDRHESLTAAEKKTATDRSRFVNLAALSIDHKRLWGLRLDTPAPKLSIQCRWALPTAVRNVLWTTPTTYQISFNLYLRTLRNQ